MISLLPFTSDTPQGVTVQLGSAKYRFDLYWNERSLTWATDITVDATNVILLTGLPLVLGTDLLAPYDLQLGGHLMVYDENATGIDAGPEDLGDRVNVYWLDNADVGV